MKIVFSLSHGQAGIEVRFKDNVVLKQNQKDKTVVARRFIKKYVSTNDLLPLTVLVTLPSLNLFRSAWRSYKQDFEDRRKKRKKRESRTSAA